MKGEVVCVRGRWLEVCSDIKSFTPPSPTTLKACQDVIVYFNHPARSDKPYMKGKKAGEHGVMANPSSMLISHMDRRGDGNRKRQQAIRKRQNVQHTGCGTKK